MDIIFDVYLLKSLKYELRVTRGVGEMRQVRLTTKMPRNFRAFLCVDGHKTEIAPSDHEEADTRTLLHAAHMKSQGFE